MSLILTKALQSVFVFACSKIVPAKYSFALQSVVTDNHVDAGGPSMEIWTGVECASKLCFRDKPITSMTDLKFYDQLLLDTFSFL